MTKLDPQLFNVVLRRRLGHCAPADVAAKSIPLATIAQRASCRWSVPQRTSVDDDRFRARYGLN